MLGFLALNKIVKGQFEEKEVIRGLYIAGGISGALCLFFIFLGPSMFDFTSGSDARYAQAGYPIDPLIEGRKALMRSDAWRTLLLFGISGGLIWAFIKKKIQSNILLISIGVLVLFDVWSAGRRYLDSSEFVEMPKNQYEAPIAMNVADEEILKTEPHRGAYRVLDLSVSPFQSSRASYFHSSLGGYHAAKLQRYQDIIDYYLNPGIQQISRALETDPSIGSLTNALSRQNAMNMLNNKYLILSPDNPPVINPHALGNAWFVSNIRMVNSANEEINAIGNINPADEAIVNSEYSDYVANLGGSNNGSITLTNYLTDHLTYQSSSSEEQLAVFSEIWYGPKKGWEAYIDDQPVEHIRVNYFLRGLKIPAGEHKVEFRFRPKTFQTGRLLSFIFSGLVILGLLGYGGYHAYQHFQNLPEETPPPKPEPKRKTKAQSPARSGKKTGNKKKKKK